MRAIGGIGYACIAVAVAALVLVSVLGSAQGTQRWYAYGYYSSWSNGVKGTLTTYYNYVSDNNHFTAIYIAIIFPNNEWLAVGFYDGRITCGLNGQPTWYSDQSVNGQYACGLITNAFPSTGVDYPYKVYDVPGTMQWNGNINSGLVKTTAFSYNYGYGWGIGEANGQGNQMKGWFKSMQYGQVRGGTTIYWYDWPSLSTHQDYPYYVTVISAKEFKTASSTNP